MAEDYLQRLLAERIGGPQFGLKEEIYKFEKIKRAKREAIQANPYMNLIDLGIGEPDAMADEKIVQILTEEANKPENRYYADNGIAEFKQAAASYMDRVFGVKNLDARTEINHVIGSKSALAILPSIFINHGDLTLIPSPSYPIIATHTNYCGGNVIDLPLTEENSFLPKLDTLDESILSKAKLLYLNYPNNPTGATATAEFFEEVVHFAKKNKLIVVHDAAYAALVFDEEQPLSFLSITGAKDVGVELHSLSKSFNMTGWRIGFIAGNSRLIEAFAAVKDNYDSGQFIAIQKAAAYALSQPDLTEDIAEKYSRRHEQLVKVLNEVGFIANKPNASFFLYTKAPRAVVNGPSFRSAEAFSQYLIKEHLISTVPWDDVGQYVRFSVTFQANSIDEEMQVMEEIRSRLRKDQFVFERGGRGAIY